MNTTKVNTRTALALLFGRPDFCSDGETLPAHELFTFLTGRVMQPNQFRVESVRARAEILLQCSKLNDVLYTMATHDSLGEHLESFMAAYSVPGELEFTRPFYSETAYQVIKALILEPKKRLMHFTLQDRLRVIGFDNEATTLCIHRMIEDKTIVDAGEVPLAVSLL